MPRPKKSDSEKAAKDKSPKTVKADKPAKEKKAAKNAKKEKVPEETALPAEKAATKKATAKTAKASKSAKASELSKALDPVKISDLTIQISIEEISLRAYYIAERRHVKGWPGDSTSDWVEAERQLKREAAKVR